MGETAYRGWDSRTIIGAATARRRSEILARVPFDPRDVQVDTLEQLMFGPDCDRTRGGLVSPYDEPL